jgi:cell division protein FtsB
LSDHRKKSSKTLFIILFIIMIIVAWLGFGERGFINLYRVEMKRRDCIERIHKLAKENNSLMEEIELLRNNMKYVESLARKELNLIKQGEFLYRFSKQEPNKEIAETPESAQ